MDFRIFRIVGSIPYVPFHENRNSSPPALQPGEQNELSCVPSGARDSIENLGRPLIRRRTRLPRARSQSFSGNRPFCRLWVLLNIAHSTVGTSSRTPSTQPLASPPKPCSAIGTSSRTPCIRKGKHLEVPPCTHNNPTPSLSLAIDTQSLPD